MADEELSKEQEEELKEEQLDKDEKLTDCPKCKVGYPLVKYSDGIYRCGHCKFETKELLSKNQKGLE